MAAALIFADNLGATDWPSYLGGNGAAIGFVNLIYSLAHYEQIVRAQLLLLRGL